ncbi:MULTISPECIES: cell division protein FtsL [Colwelliaceae]|uniref:Cell division protein FtsL n=1 Tax=Cognaticolwellia beringensis TaxID=1967665 RepID=A0A222G3L2_9GAMM|nr:MULTISPECIES: cell division protein FtsL [Colwelliaceae]ARD43899.1 cell division protein FtsL [Colwellia sp. PAMC 21821]ASP46361.1 cell division protein FtsL [Cognaticolwellia beringensis]
MATPKVVLTLDIWHDIKRHLVIYGILLLVLISAFSVIYFTHLNRQTTSKIEVLLTERDALENEWRNLLLEQNSLAEHSAIESSAEKQLNMTRPDASSEIIIKLL